MTEEERVAADKARKDAEEAERAETARKDASAGEKLDKILSHLGEINKRVDSLEAMKANADAESAVEEKMEEGRPNKVAADDDGTDEEEAKKAEDDKARKDSDAVIADLKSRLDALSAVAVRHVTDDERGQLAGIHAKWDKAYTAFGDSASYAMPGETPDQYRRRLANGLRKHSAIFGKIDLAHLDKDGLDVAEGQIYADAMTAARAPTIGGGGKLRSIQSKTAAGHTMIDYIGTPNDWMKKFSSARHRVTKIGAPSNSQGN